MKRILCAAMMLILTGCVTKQADPTDIVSTPAVTQTPEVAVMPAPEATKTPAVSEPEATETPTEHQLYRNHAADARYLPACHVGRG